MLKAAVRAVRDSVQEHAASASSPMATSWSSRCRGEVITKTGKPYNNTYCFVIRMRDGKMVELTEYFDTELVTAALEPPAWA